MNEVDFEAKKVLFKSTPGVKFKITGTLEHKSTNTLNSKFVNRAYKQRKLQIDHEFKSEDKYLILTLVSD